MSDINIKEIVSCITNYLNTAAAGGPGFISVLAGFLILVFIGIWSIAAIINISLRIKDTGSACVSDLFSFFSELPQFYIGLFIVTSMVTLGLFALIIPGIYLAIRSTFVMQLVLDKKMSGFAAVKGSFALTKGHVGNILLLIIKLLLITIAVAIISFLIISLFSVDYAYIQNRYIISAIKYILNWLMGTFTALAVVNAYRQLN